MRYKRISAIAIVGILIASFGLGTLVLSRISILASLAKKNGVNMQVEGTSLEMTMYGYPEQSRPMFDVFQYFKTERLTWKGILPQPQPPSPPSPTGHIGLNLSYIEFQKVDQDHYNLTANDVEFRIWADDVVDGFIKADFVDVNITFWMSGELPALNVTALLRENVNVRLSASILPLPGISFAAYQYVGPTYFINICIIKPAEVRITNPVPGQTISNKAPIEASIKTAPGIKVRNVWWYADGPSHYEGGMNYNESTGIAQATWETWHGPDGEYWIRARVEAYQEGIQGPTYYVESPSVKAFVDNPSIWVTSWVWNDTQKRYIHKDGVQVNGGLNGKGRQFETPIELDRYRWNLEAPGEWDFGGGLQVQFERWVISDGDPNTGWYWEHGGNGIGINDWMLEALYGKQMQILYKPK